MSDPRGAKYDPEELFSSDFALAMVEFASLFRPGWLERGTVWPTHLFERAGLEPQQFFEPAELLFGPMLDRAPENYCLGGYVPAKKVAALLEYVQRHIPQLKNVYDSGAPAEPPPVYLQKLMEALYDAKRHGFAFLEATEVYSGPLGALN